MDEPALVDALRRRRIGGAALDVRRVEEGPRATADKLYGFPNVILTPHAAWYSTGSLVELRRRAARNVASVLAGGTPIDPVNPYIKPRFGPDAETPSDLDLSDDRGKRCLTARLMSARARTSPPRPSPFSQMERGEGSPVVPLSTRTWRGARGEVRAWRGRGVLGGARGELPYRNAYPLIPVIAMPSMKVRCVRK